MIHNPCHVLVENYQDYRFARENCGRESRNVFFTTSPWLLERLPGEGNEVIPLEMYATQSRMDQIGRFCKEASLKIADLMDCGCSEFPHGIRAGHSLLVSIRKTLFVLFYKLYLLQTFLLNTKSSGCQGMIVGNDEISPVKGFFIDVGRFDTLFSALAKSLELPTGVTLVKHLQEKGEQAAYKIDRLGKSVPERFLLLLNLNPSLALFKAWKSILRFRKLELPYKRKRVNILFYKSCELVEEAIPFLLLYAGRLDRLRLDLKAWNCDRPSGVDEVHAGDVLERLLKCNPPQFDEGVFSSEGLRSVADIIASRLNHAIRIGRNWFNCFDDLHRLGQGNGGLSPFALVSNTLSTPIDRALSLFLKKNGVPIFVAEHGVTHGLSEISKDAVEYQSSMLSGDYGVYYNEVSCEIHKSSPFRTRGFVAGSPFLNRRVSLKGLQRMVAGRVFGMPRSGRSVVYVANLYCNNNIYNPGISNDYEYHRFKKRVVYEILGRLQEPCLIKLYPTHRFVEDDPFLELMTLPANVKAVQYFEYRYMRAMGDVVLCDSPQSTLGWVWSTQVPLIFFDLPSNPLLPEVAEAFDGGIFRIDVSRPDWVDRTVALLTLPHEELTKRWAEKKDARAGVEQRYIFGPSGNAGKRFARFVVAESLRWSERQEEDSGTASPDSFHGKG